MRQSILLIVIGILFMSCATPISDMESQKKQLTVSILPQKYFLQRIIGNNSKFNIQVLIPPGHSPATYSPTPRQMQILSHSNLYFRIGYIAFEKAWIENIVTNNPDLNIIDTSNGVDLITPSTVKEKVKNHHNHHHQTGIDPHIWLSPQAVKIQIKNILAALIQLDNQNQKVYNENYRNFITDIERIDKEIKILLENFKGKKFMVFHPAWSYFARDYGLIQIPIEIEGKEPSPADMKKIIDIARKEDIHIIFVQSQFDTHSAQTVVNEINGQVLQIDPLAEDWLNNMRHIAQLLNKVLNKEPIINGDK